jgi:hypothetical protein
MKDEKTKLKKFKNNLRDLVKGRQSIKNQRKILIQKGGYILPVILPAIIESFKLLFSK